MNSIYADAFVQKTNGNNEAYPEVSSSLKKSFEDGSLFINYQGHGEKPVGDKKHFLTFPQSIHCKTPIITRFYLQQPVNSPDSITHYYNQQVKKLCLEKTGER